MASFIDLSGTSKPHLFLIICTTAAPASAQMPSPAPSRDIIVTGPARILGMEPDRVITEEEVASYGLSSIGELVDELANERGKRPDDVVYLINGKRVTGLGDIGSYPTEAIRGIELLPTGSAIKVGGSVNQQIVNISLKPKVRAVVGRAAAGLATDGDFSAYNGDVGVTDIVEGRRIGATLRWRRENALLEEDRNVLQSAGAPADLGRFRTLRPEFDELELRASVADQLAPTLNGFVTARLFDGSTRSSLGLDMANDRIDQRSALHSANLDMQLNGEIASWLVAFNASYVVNRRRTQTGRAIDSAGATMTRATTRNASTEMIATGPLINLPAGPIMLTLRGRIGRNSIEAGAENFVQNNREIGAGIQVPIARASEGPLGALGNLTAGAEWSHNRTTRAGTFSGMTYSLLWEPSDRLRLNGSISTSTTPPGIDLLAAPVLTTPGVRYLDPLDGTARDVVEVSGGNAALDAQRGNTRRLSLEFRPMEAIPLTLTADYVKTRNRDTITALPPGNSLLLLAFPDRFLRDANGRLTQVDVRPVNFARQSEEQLRYGFDLTIPVGVRSRPGSDTSATTVDRQPFVGRLQFNLSHSIILKSEILVGAGFDAVDLLSRDAFGLSGTERPRHEFDFGIGFAERGLGLKLTGQHKTKSFLGLTGGSAPNVLRFSPLTTLGFRAFVEGQRLLPSAGWLKGARLSLSVNNLTNTRQKVRDSAGNVPLPYQPAYRDPIGRLVQFEFRKSF